MENIRLKDYLASIGKVHGKYLKLDDGQLRTAEEWEAFLEDKIKK